jgi:hypothetical protein
MIPLSGRVPGRASGPSRSRDDDGGGLQYVSWKSVRPLRGFPVEVNLEAEGQCQGMDQGSTPPGGAARGWLAPPYGAAAFCPPSVSPLDSIFVSGK